MTNILQELPSRTRGIIVASILAMVVILVGLAVYATTLDTPSEIMAPAPSANNQAIEN